MKFKATRNQLLCIMANAVNFSRPVGLGFLQFEDKIYSPEDMEKYILNDDTIFADLDYVDGRMVKLTIFKEGSQYVIKDNFSLGYQSFANRYPNVSELLKSVNIK